MPTNPERAESGTLPPLGTCADFPSVPHPKGTCESCDCWEPLAVSPYINEVQRQLTAALARIAALEQQSCEDDGTRNALTIKLEAANAKLAQLLQPLGERPKVKAYPAHGNGFIAYIDPAEADPYIDSLTAAFRVEKERNAELESKLETWQDLSTYENER